ncbi:hypothetical protein LX36DRAFT_18924 [Colletotrichum falcatum]|nr:hypothetical protein LX36DRAFT_18924 [Colletotrichum falcatum]
MLQTCSDFTACAPARPTPPRPNNPFCRLDHVPLPLARSASQWIQVFFPSFFSLPSSRRLYDVPFLQRTHTLDGALNGHESQRSPDVEASEAQTHAKTWKVFHSGGFVFKAKRCVVLHQKEVRSLGLFLLVEHCSLHPNYLDQIRLEGNACILAAAVGILVTTLIFLMVGHPVLPVVLFVPCPSLIPCLGTYKTLQKEKIEG